MCYKLFILESTTELFKVLFLDSKEHKYNEKTFVFCLLGGSLDSIKDDPPIRKRDQQP